MRQLSGGVYEEGTNILDVTCNIILDIVDEERKKLSQMQQNVNNLVLEHLVIERKTILLKVFGSELLEFQEGKEDSKDVKSIRSRMDHMQEFIGNAHSLRNVSIPIFVTKIL